MPPLFPQARKTNVPGLPEKPAGAAQIAAERRERLETSQRTAERNAGRYGRMSRLSLDEGNKERYALLADEWGGRALGVKERLSKAYGSNYNDGQS